MINEVRLGIGVACVAAHQASLADERGEFLWSGWRFRTVTEDLERLWAKIPRYRQLRGRLGRLERPLVKLSPEALHSLATDLIRQHHD